MSEHEKRLNACAASLLESGDLTSANEIVEALAGLIAEHRAALSSARDAALEEAAIRVEASARRPDDFDLAAGIRALKSRPVRARYTAEEVDTAMREAVLCERDRMAVQVLLHTPLVSPQVVSADRVREAAATHLTDAALLDDPLDARASFLSTLGVDLDATGGDITKGVTDHPETWGTEEQAQALRDGKPLEWKGEPATVDNGGLPAPMCQGCRQRHSPRVKCPTKSRVYDEPAHEVPHGTCKGCSAPEDAPPNEHRFSCTVKGKRQLMLGADKGTSGKVKR